MAKTYEEVLGDNLLALQLGECGLSPFCSRSERLFIFFVPDIGNEPDLFGVNNRERPTSYTIQEYFAEYSNVC